MLIRLKISTAGAEVVHPSHKHECLSSIPSTNKRKICVVAITYSLRAGEAETGDPLANHYTKSARDPVSKTEVQRN